MYACFYCKRQLYVAILNKFIIIIIIITIVVLSVVSRDYALSALARISLSM